MRRFSRLLGCLVLLGGLLGAGAANAVPEVTAVRVGEQAPGTRVVLDLTEPVDYRLFTLENPHRVVLDLPELAWSAAEAEVGPGVVTRLRHGLFRPGTSRVVLDLLQAVKVQDAFLLPPNAEHGYRLVVDMEPMPGASAGVPLASVAPEPIRTASLAPSLPVVRPPEKPVVVIDAGHGGIDTGAIGEDTRTLEKDITLDFARAFARKLQAVPGYDSYLTRDEDIYLSLTRRVELARQHGADLFISLHADSLNQPDISGATVYTLSDRASDRLAAALAKRENLSNEIMGIEASVEPEEVTDILLDLTRRETQSFSISLADQVVASFEGQISLINNPHRYAGFMVLRAPDIPSILLEIGFLSNPEDEKRMLDPVWRDKLVGRLVDAVTRYRSPMVSAMP